MAKAKIGKLSIATKDFETWRTDKIGRKVSNTTKQHYTVKGAMRRLRKLAHAGLVGAGLGPNDAALTLLTVQKVAAQEVQKAA